MRGRIGRGVGAAIIAGVFVVGPAVGLAAPVTDEGQGVRGGPAIDDEECKALKDINRFRRERGLKPLVLDRDLVEAADHHSQDMARHDYFSHTLDDRTSWEENIRDFGYRSDPVGENIFAGRPQGREAFQAWERSRGHRETMLGRSYRAIGVARAFDRDAEYGWYWTTTFGGKVENKVTCR